MPIIGNIVPIRRALSRSLSESLDVYHQSQAEVVVTLVHLEKLGVSPAQTATAVSMAVVGGSIYYLIPLAFMIRNFDLLLSTLNAILMASLVGMVILGAVFQPALERAVVWVMLSLGPDKRLHSIVIKNLVAHRPRMRKTALMFSTSMAFAVFAGAMFALQAESIVGNVQAFMGADLIVKSQRLGLDEPGLSALMDSEMAKDDSLVEGYSFVTYPATLVDPPFYFAWVSNLPNYPFRVRANIYGIQDNFLDVTYSKFFVPKEQDLSLPDGGMAGNVFQLLNRPGQSLTPIQSPINPLVGGVTYPMAEFDAMVPTSLESAMSVGLKSPLDVTIETRSSRERPFEVQWHDYIVHIRALASKVPGFFFSSYGATSALGVPVLIGMNTWHELHNQTVTALGANLTVPDSPPKERMFIKLRPDASSLDRERLNDIMRPYLQEDTDVSDTRAAVNETRDTVDLLMLFFYIVSCVASVLCFFILWTSFDANVRENLWQFGVLRSLGLSASQLIRVYVYESAATIAAALVIGTSIGFVIAITLTVQQNLFTEMPFEFQFPGLLFGGLIVSSVLVATLGGYFPAAVHRDTPIAQILKGK
mmetsp:Transcript_32034/g.75305  ORF Transcript_32034/g.75305 Transcript_32034/m.75305 type:complete len:590 (+) Transcript_32034:1826-3595(+)